MNSKPNGKFPSRRFQALTAAAALVTGMCFGTAAYATPLTIVSVVGGAPTGVTHENFDNLPLGNSGGTTGSGIVVSFAPDAQAVQGTLANTYAAPFLSGGNGLGFGSPNQPNGQDATTFLTSGSTGGVAGAAVTLTLPGLEKYMGILWGSVDTYNTLTFYNGNTLVGSITGTDVDTAANGNQGATGTFYVNINSSMAFDRVVATSSQYAFEFDNVAFNPTPVAVPEPGVLGLFGLGLLLVGSGYWLQRRRLT
ncbi:MAG: Npun_F0296 family exosortase-dependent surface protein [Rhodanobacteraceae bacterium]